MITLVRNGKCKRKVIDDAGTKNTCLKSMGGPNMNSNKTLVHTNKFSSAFIHSLIEILYYEIHFVNTNTFLNIMAVKN